MLIICIQNEGTDEAASYRYKVMINQNAIAVGKVKGHNRKEGWKKLLKLVAENKNEKHLADVLMDFVEV